MCNSMSNGGKNEEGMREREAVVLGVILHWEPQLISCSAFYCHASVIVPQCHMNGRRTLPQASGSSVSVRISRATVPISM